jgi:RimJ/RimL family protein N-acetyltransferase
MSDPVELKTERLLLRPFRVTDAEDVFAYAGDPEWAPHLGPLPPFGYHDAEEYVAGRIVASWSTNPSFAMVIDSSVVGAITLAIKESREAAELSYAIARVHWGQGLVAEAARAVIDWGFRHRNLAKIYASADMRNQRSWRVMEKIGMIREGVLRRHVKILGQRADMAYYGLLREEWRRGGSRLHSGGRSET